MDYKSLMGYDKKKKVIKEQSKPKKTVLDGVKQELNEWSYQPPTAKRWSKNTFDTGLTEFEQRGGKDTIKEVGMAADIKKYTKAIDKDFESLAKSVYALKDLLIKNGAKKEALELGSIFVTNVGKFRKFMKIKWLKMLRNLI